MPEWLRPLRCKAPGPCRIAHPPMSVCLSVINKGRGSETPPPSLLISRVLCTIDVVLFLYYCCTCVAWLILCVDPGCTLLPFVTDIY
jgi:hypothetical protein